MVISNVIVDWLFVFRVGNKGKYGLTILLPKGSKQEAEVKAAIEKAKADGISKNKFTAPQTKSANFKGCIQDGDVFYEAGERGTHYKGMSFVNANNAEQPGIIGPDGKPVMDPKPYYSGWKCHVDVNFAPFNNESKGVGCYLNHIMFVEAGERLDNRTNVEDAFKDFMPVAEAASPAEDME